MRILATNPDTIGDLVLRQPLYASLQEAGHELMLVIRPLLEPIVSQVAPGATVATVRQNVYDPRLEAADGKLDEIAAAGREFDPDVLLVTPFQWTVLEERLAMELPRARRIVMSGKRYADPHFGPAPESKLDPQQVVQVAEDAPEIRKNELLAGAVLGKAVRLPEPRLAAAPEHLRAAEAHLSRLGLVPGYWIACIGHSQHTQVRNWHMERWAEVLGSWAKEHGRRFLLVGHESEKAVAEEIRKGMGDQSGACAVWAGCGDGDLDVLLGLVSHSAGYVGRDTGPMHLSAAMEKPVLAVFGGGTWPRFVPATAKSISITIGVPCAGCNWKCHLPESYCIKEVPVEAVLEGMEDLVAGRIEERTVRVLAPSAELLSTVGREGAASARDLLTQLSVNRRVQMEQTESMAQVLERTARQAGRADVLEQQLESLRAESNRRESVLKQRLAAAENLYRTREADLQRRIDDLEAGRTVPQSLQDKMAALEAEWAGKLSAAQERSRQVHEQYLEHQSEVADLRLKLERALSDQQALMTLTRQQEQQLGVLHQRLGDLMHSRWRKYGQRLKLCMTMPWEAQYQNGKR